MVAIQHPDHKCPHFRSPRGSSHPDQRRSPQPCSSGDEYLYVPATSMAVAYDPPGDGSCLWHCLGWRRSQLTRDTGEVLTSAMLAADPPPMYVASDALREKQRCRLWLQQHEDMPLGNGKTLKASIEEAESMKTEEYYTAKCVLKCKVPRSAYGGIVVNAALCL